MKRTLMIGVAAGALLAGVNIAASQSTMERQGGANIEQKGGAQPAQQKADSPAGNRAQAQEKAMPQDKAQAQDKDKKSTTGQSGQRMEPQKQGDQKAGDQKAGEQKAQDTQKMDTQKGAQTKPDAKSGTSAQGDSKSGSTSAQGSAGASGKAANLNAEQKTKIRETVIRSSNAPRVTNVNFSVSVGTVIPANVHFVALPPVLVEIFPEWRGYDYIIVDDRIVILEPRTRKIVTILVV